MHKVAKTGQSGALKAAVTIANSHLAGATSTCNAKCCHDKAERVSVMQWQGVAITVTFSAAISNHPNLCGLALQRTFFQISLRQKSWQLKEWLRTMASSWGIDTWIARRNNFSKVWDVEGKWKSKGRKKSELVFVSINQKKGYRL